MPPRNGLSTKAIVTSGIILIMVMSSLGFILQNAGGGAQRFGKYKFSPSVRAMPVISCGNATPEVPVIYVRKGDSTGFHLEGDCIVMEAASEQDIYRLYDRMLLSLLGVMP